jgi:hypothetical protein
LNVEELLLAENGELAEFDSHRDPRSILIHVASIWCRPRSPPHRAP